jgi:hypothetical protein
VDGGAGPGRVSAAGAGYGREEGIKGIDGGCPLVGGGGGDAGHRAMRVVLTLGGKVPRQV